MGKPLLARCLKVVVSLQLFWLAYASPRSESTSLFSAKLHLVGDIGGDAIIRFTCRERIQRKSPKVRPFDGSSVVFLSRISGVG